MRNKDGKTLVEFTCRHGKNRVWVDPKEVIAISMKTAGETNELVTIVMLTSGQYVIVDGTPTEVARRIAE